MAVALDVEIRLLRPADASQVAELLAVAFAEEFEGSGAGMPALVRQLRTGGLVQSGLLRRLTSLVGVEFAFFVAVHRDRVVGCTGVMGRQLPVVNSVAVHPEFRRRGIAEALVLAAEHHAADHGHDAVVLDVLAHNTAAHTLYMKLGYEEYHRYRAYAAPLNLLLRDGVWGGCHDRRGPFTHPFPAGSGEESGAAYLIARPGRDSAAAFEAIERAALPERFRAISPSLRPHYLGGPPALVERLVGGSRSYRRLLIHHGEVAGYLAGHLSAGVSEARVEYPLVPAEHTAALPLALADAAATLAGAGATTLRVDLSDDRPDQHAAVEALGLTHRWTFVQMTRRLSRGVRIPVRRDREQADHP